MKDKYQNKYRIASTRLKNWNYAWQASYFLTICTRNRACYFGEISNGEMQLSDIGSIVKEEWLKTFKMRPDMNLRMGEYVIMPNHFHAIICIGENAYNRGGNPEYILGKNKFGAQSKNLASVIRGFKIGVTKNARKTREDFAWQTRYYDQIIRDHKSIERINRYIRENPLKWEEDKFHIQ